MTASPPKPEPAEAVIPAIYVHYIPVIVELAREFGYAIGLHGSMRRDLDLIAVPWTEEAKPAEELVKAIHDRITDHPHPFDATKPTQKPHGRLAWSILIGGHLYVDISVMPLTRPITASEVMARDAFDRWYVDRCAQRAAAQGRLMTEPPTFDQLDDNVCRGCGSPWGMRHAETCKNAAHPPRATTNEANPEGPQG